VVTSVSEPLCLGSKNDRRMEIDRRGMGLFYLEFDGYGRFLERVRQPTKLTEKEKDHRIVQVKTNLK